MDKNLCGLSSAYLSKLICCTCSSLLSPPAKMASYCPQLCQAPSYLKDFAHAASPAWNVLLPYVYMAHSYLIKLIKRPSLTSLSPVRILSLALFFFLALIAT